MIREIVHGKYLELAKVKTKADKESLLKQICDEFGFEYVPSQIFSSVIQLKPGVACIDCAKRLKLLEHLHACHYLINSETGFAKQIFLENATITLLREILPGRELEEIAQLAKKLLALIEHREEGKWYKFQASHAQLPRRASLLASFLEQSLVQAGYQTAAADDSSPSEYKIQLIAANDFSNHINSLDDYSRLFKSLFSLFGFSFNTTLFSAEVKQAKNDDLLPLVDKRVLVNLLAECHYVINVKQRLSLDRKYLQNKIKLFLQNFSKKNKVHWPLRHDLEGFVDVFIDLMDAKKYMLLATCSFDKDFKACPLPLALLYQLLHRELTEAGQEMASSGQLFANFEVELNSQLAKQEEIGAELSLILAEVESCRAKCTSWLDENSARRALVSPWLEENITHQVAKFQRASLNLDVSLNKFIRDLTEDKLSRDQCKKSFEEWFFKQCSENILQLLASPLLDWLEFSCDSRSLLESFKVLERNFLASSFYLEVILKGSRLSLDIFLDPAKFASSKHPQRFERCRDSILKFQKLKESFCLSIKDALLQVQELNLPRLILSSIEVQDELAELERLRGRLLDEVRKGHFDSRIKEQLDLEHKKDLDLGLKTRVAYSERSLRRMESIKKFKKGLVALSKRSHPDVCSAYTSCLQIVEQLIASKQRLAKLCLRAKNEPDKLTQDLKQLDQEKAQLEELNNQISQRQEKIELYSRALPAGERWLYPLNGP